MRVLLKIVDLVLEDNGCLLSSEQVFKLNRILV